MLRSIAVQRVQAGLGFTTALADQIILRMQEEQRDLERGKTLPKFLLVEDATLNLLTGTSSVNLPIDFLRRSHNMLTYVPTGTTVARTIPWREKDEARKVYADNPPAGPHVAVLQTATIGFFPVADKNYPITWDYYAEDDLLTSDIENLWLANAPELIIGGAGLRIAQDKRDKAAVDLFGNMYKQARITWLGETVVQESDDGPLLLGANA
jgi:hypothetical protein